MILRPMIAATAVLLSAAAPAAPPPAGKPATASETAAAPIPRCSARKYQTFANITIDGRLRPTRMLICSKGPESKSEWSATLARAMAGVQLNPKIPAAAKAKLVGELKAEIARVNAAP